MCHLSVPCDWSMQPSVESKADFQCLRTGAERTEGTPHRGHDNSKTLHCPASHSACVALVSFSASQFPPHPSLLARVPSGCLPLPTLSRRRARWCTLAFLFQHSFPALFTFPSSVPLRRPSPLILNSVYNWFFQGCVSSVSFAPALSLLTISHTQCTGESHSFKRWVGIMEFPWSGPHYRSCFHTHLSENSEYQHFIDLAEDLKWSHE